jgi:hypothetical protein
MKRNWVRGVQIIFREKTLAQQLLLFLFGYFMYCVAEHISQPFAIIMTIGLFGFIFPWFFGIVDDLERS